MTSIETIRIFGETTWQRTISLKSSVNEPQFDAMCLNFTDMRNINAVHAAEFLRNGGSLTVSPGSVILTATGDSKATRAFADSARGDIALSRGIERLLEHHGDPIGIVFVSHSALMSDVGDRIQFVDLDLDGGVGVDREASELFVTFKASNAQHFAALLLIPSHPTSVSSKAIARAVVNSCGRGFLALSTAFDLPLKLNMQHTEHRSELQTLFSHLGAAAAVNDSLHLPEEFGTRLLLLSRDLSTLKKVRKYATSVIEYTPKCEIRPVMRGESTFVTNLEQLESAVRYCRRVSFLGDFDWLRDGKHNSSILRLLKRAPKLEVVVMRHVPPAAVTTELVQWLLDTRHIRYVSFADTDKYPVLHELAAKEPLRFWSKFMVSLNYSKLARSGELVPPPEMLPIAKELLFLSNSRDDLAPRFANARAAHEQSEATTQEDFEGCVSQEEYDRIFGIDNDKIS